MVTHVFGNLRFMVNPVVIHVNNQGALQLLLFPILSMKSQHIDVLYRFARE